MKRIKRPFAITAVSLLTALAALMLYGEKLFLCIILIISAVCIITAVLQKAVSKVWLLICITFVIAGLLFEANSIIPNCLSKVSLYNADISGTLLTYPQKTDGDSFLAVISYAEVNGIAVDGKINVYGSFTGEPAPGDRVSFNASELSSIQSEGLFRYHSLSQKIRFNTFSDGNIEIIEKHSEKNIYTKILTLKKYLSDKYTENLSSDSSAITNALISGDKSTLSPQMNHSFRVCGISHIFAVSGMHLSLWTGIFFLIFKQRAKTAFIPNVAAIIFILFFCIFTGFSPSVLRSGIMLIILFLSKIIQKHSDAINTWGITGTVLLTVNPFLAGNISFLLSYIATFAMLFFNTYIFSQNNRAYKNHIFLKKQLFSVKSSFLVSLSVTLVTLPLNALFFGYISLLSPLASLILTPVAEAIMITSGISAIIPAGNLLSVSAFYITELFCNLLLSIINTLKNFDFMILSLDIKLILPFFIITAFTVGLIIRFTKNNTAAIKCILLSTVFLMTAITADYHINLGETKIFIPAAGNATIIAVTRDEAKAFIYGSGGSFSACSDTVNYLNRNGIFRIDHLLIPRSKTTESLNTDYFTSRLFPIKTTNLYKTGAKKIYEEELWHNTRLYSEISSDFAATVIYTDNIKIVICPLPSSDFSSNNSVFTDGDILICRNKIPLTLSEESFRNIIIMSESSSLTNTDNIIYTSDKNTEITIKGDSYAVNR